MATGFIVMIAFSLMLTAVAFSHRNDIEMIEKVETRPGKPAKPKPPSKGSLAGIITDSDTGRPVRGALVQSGLKEIFTDEKGHFEFDELVAEPVVLDVAKAGYPPVQTSLDIKGGSNETTVSLTSPFRAPSGPRYASTAPQVIRKGNTKRRQVALTFDDGWHPDYRILGLLEENHIPATVFIVGGRGVVEKHHDFIERMDEDGFEVTTHGYTHYINTNMTDEQLTEEIRKGQKIITTITRKQFPYFRAPGGLYNSRTLGVIAANGYKLVLWSIDSEDTRGGLTTQQRYSQIIQHLHNGAIIVFHFSGHNTYELLQMLIPALQTRGYEITTVSELLKP